MSRGQPDYGMYAPKEVSASISDMGEVAARLGSIVIYDKRGDVVEFDNFEAALVRWYQTTGGDPCYIALDSLNARSGIQSLRMDTQVDWTGYARIARAQSILSSKRLGLEISFCRVGGGLYLYLRYLYYDGATALHATVRVDISAEKIAILKDDNTYEDIIDTGPISTDRHLFYTIKLVADFATKKYVRLMFGPTEYDISSYSLFEEVQVVAPRIYYDIYMDNKGKPGADGWIDDFILTQAEP